MAERKKDRSFGVRTTGIREWGREENHYNRYEATPYVALDRLFENYGLDKNDKVVDFGCGRGRVAFYIHNRFQVPVTGVEAHDRTYEEALKNKTSYRQRAKHIKAPIKLEYGAAEHYEIEPDENKFYFFNPFSIKVFRKVVNNILESVRLNSRTIDLIIYYPTAQYKQFLKNHTPFDLINKVRIPKVGDKKEKFLIYRLRKEDIEENVG